MNIQPELTADDLIKIITDFNQWLDTIIMLLNIDVKNGVWINWNGERLAAQTRQDAIKQEVVRAHELIRVRQKLWTADIDETKKMNAIDSLNIMGRILTNLANGLDITVDDVERLHYSLMGVV